MQPRLSVRRRRITGSQTWDWDESSVFDSQEEIKTTWQEYVPLVAEWGSVILSLNFLHLYNRDGDAGSSVAQGISDTVKEWLWESADSSPGTM